jgi:hypothetical protein
MRTLYILPITLLLATACAKQVKELAQETGVLPAGCGQDGARLQAQVGGTTFCADMQLQVIADEGSVIITGIGLNASSLMLQIDDLAVGTHAITEAANAMVFMHNGQSFTVQQGASGALDITALDLDARTLRAHFSVELRNEMSGETRLAQGALEVGW